MKLEKVIDDLAIIGARILWGKEGFAMLRKASEDVAEERKKLKSSPEEVEKAETVLKEISAVYRKCVLVGIRAVMRELKISPEGLKENS